MKEVPVLLFVVPSSRNGRAFFIKLIERRSHSMLSMSIITKINMITIKTFGTPAMFICDATDSAQTAKDFNGKNWGNRILPSDLLIYQSGFLIS